MKALFMLLPILLLAASVNVNVNKKVLTSGEELIITISAEGKNIKFPNINEIDGNNIIGTSNSDNISIINGNMKETITKSFILFPQKSFTIPSFTVIVNGKVYHTKPIHIKVIQPKQTKGNFELDINISKKNLYLGESGILTLKFIKKAPAQSIQIQKPYIKNFLIKEINSKEIKKPNEDILIYKFLLIPQKTGNYQIGPVIAQIGKMIKEQTNDFFGIQITSMKYKNIYSNKLKVRVMPIPKNSIYGNFNISITSKKTLKPNEPNKVKLIIKGCGDFYSIEPFNLKIKNVTIYQGKPKLNLKIKNNKLCGEFVQTFTIIANNSYEIPSIKLKTFNGKIHIISTPKVFVKINNPQIIKNKKIPNLQSPIAHMEKHNVNLGFILLISLISLIIGILIGILVIKIYNYLKQSETIKIKQADNKELLNILKKYEENEQIKEIMKKIEENIYKNANHKINKKDIIKIIKNIRRGK